MSVPATPRRAILDAIALVLAFLMADGAVIFAVLAGWVEQNVGFTALLALAAVILLSSATTSQQIRLVNALGRFAEVAESR